MVTLALAGLDVGRGLFRQYYAKTVEKKTEAAEEWILGTIKTAAAFAAYAVFCAALFTQNRIYQCGLSVIAFYICPTAALEALTITAGLTGLSRFVYKHREMNRQVEELRPLLQQAAELARQEGLQIPDQWWSNKFFQRFQKPTYDRLQQIYGGILKQAGKYEQVRAEADRLSINFSDLSYLIAAMIAGPVAFVAAHVDPTRPGDTVARALDPLQTKIKMKKMAHTLAVKWNSA